MKRKIFSLLVVCTLLILFLVGTQSYFNYKEINYASEKCFEIGGDPQVTIGFLATEYSFSCDASK